MVSVRDALDHTELDNDVIRLLESGKNVISSTSYFYPPMRGVDYAKRLEAACLQGGSSLHGTGIHPAMMAQVLGVTLSGFVLELEHFRVEEFADLSALANPNMLAAAGFGLAREDVEQGGPAMEIWNTVYRDMCGLVAKIFFDADPDSVVVKSSSTCELTDEDFEIPGLVKVPEGRALTLKHTHLGYVDGRQVLTDEHTWYLGPENCPVPGGVASTSHYAVTVEGKPVSVRIGFDAKASFERDLLKWEGDPTLPIYYCAVSAMVQAIPVVCAAPPGFVYPETFTHYGDDLRRLARA